MNIKILKIMTVVLVGMTSCTVVKAHANHMYQCCRSCAAPSYDTCRVCQPCWVRHFPSITYYKPYFDLLTNRYYPQVRETVEPAEWLDLH